MKKLQYPHSDNMQRRIIMPHYITITYFPNIYNKIGNIEREGGERCMMIMIHINFIIGQIINIFITFFKLKSAVCLSSYF